VLFVVLKVQPLGATVDSESGTLFDGGDGSAERVREPPRGSALA
jgi:hypothetical protein